MNGLPPHPAQKPPAGDPGRPPARTPATARELSALAADLYREGPLMLRLMQRYRPFISPFELLLPHVPSGATILDVGCGGGLLTALLGALGRVTWAVGFDSSAAAIEAANGAKRSLGGASGRGAALRFERLDAAAPWPTEPARFDVVSIIDVIHHVDPAHQQGVIETACGRVKPGGVLLYKDMCRRPWWRAGANRLHDLVMARQWIRYAPIEQVEAWVTARGLVLEHRADITRLWYGHELRVFRRPAP